MSYRKKHIKSKIHKITPKKSVIRGPTFWIFILLSIVFFATLYFLLFYSGFQVKNIIISGNEKIQSKDIKNLVSKNIGKKIISIGRWNVESRSIFLINFPELQKMILNTFPIIETATVKRQLPQGVNLKIEERKPVAIFCRKERCFFIDKDGIIFEELQDVLSDMPTLKRSLDDKEAFIGENIIEKDIMNVILKIDKNLKDNFQIDMKEALLTSPLRLDIKTNENWQIYFDLNSDTDLQITKLSSLLKDEISQKERESLQYIDLRFKGRAYYK